MPLPKTLSLLILISGSQLGFTQAPNPLAQINASIRGLTRRA
jgi:hypothetical protein